MIKIFALVKYMCKSAYLRVKYRSVFPLIPDSLIDSFNTWDLDLGWSPRPNTKKRESLNGVKQNNYISIDSDGSRLRPRGCDSLNASASGQRDIAIFGDSFAMCREVDDHQTIAWNLEYTYGIACSNFGVGGYGLDQALLRLEKILGQRSFSDVMVIVCPATIARSISIYRHWLEPGNILAVKPRFLVDGDQLVLYHNPVSDKSQLKNLENLSVSIQSNDGCYEMFSKGLLTPSAKTIYEHNIEAWSSHDKLFRLMLRRYLYLAEKFNFKPYFLLLPDSTTARLSAKGRKFQFQTSLISASLEFKGIEIRDLTDDLPSLVNLQVAYTNGKFGHFSPEANEAIAGWIYRNFLDGGKVQ